MASIMCRFFQFGFPRVYWLAFLYSLATHTHTEKETQRKSKTPQVSRKQEKELEGKVADTRAHTGTHTHRAGVTRTLEAKFNKAPRESGASAAERDEDRGGGGGAHQ